MTASIIAWILLAIGVIAMLARHPVRNCQGCVWAIGGHCGHPTASQVPELVEIQLGMWRCPWRELANEALRRQDGEAEDDGQNQG